MKERVANISSRLNTLLAWMVVDLIDGGQKNDIFVLLLCVCPKSLKLQPVLYSGYDFLMFGFCLGLLDGQR